MDTVVENVLTAVATPTDRRQLLMGEIWARRRNGKREWGKRGELGWALKIKIRPLSLLPRKTVTCGM
jgi:hypothetical protein